jgi:2-C-methyl-D-erythritol 4-phosphate cytidylyltransferase
MSLGGRHVSALVLAAGRGERFGRETAKQFLDLAGRPVVSHSVDSMRASDLVDSIVVVVPANRPSWIESELPGPKVCSVVEGGAVRQASLAEGILCLPDETEVVVVHDAARPLAGIGLLERVLAGLDATVDGSVPALPIDDAVKEVSGDGLILSNRPREGIWRVQTPQAFDRSALEESLDWADAQGLVCDDCSEMLVRNGRQVRVVMGDPRNLKLTTREDFAFCEALIRGRTGPGEAPAG